jgi:glycosyltransferase involved in cell wall biosynthesis
MVNPPLVSVVIPTYNRRQLLARAIEGVRAQTYPHWEVIVVDDGSSDDTMEYVAALAATEPRVRFASNAHRSGPGGARNQGIELATGAFVAFLDSDDQWLPAKLEEQVSYFAEHPSAMALGTDCFLGGTADVDRLARRYDRIDGDRDVVFETIVRHKQFWIYTPTVMLRREVFDRVGLFNESLIRCEDLVMWLGINEQWRWHYLPRPLAIINLSIERNEAYDEKRHVPEGYYHMLFIRDIGQHVPVTEGRRAWLRRERRRPDYLYWVGRDKIQRGNPIGWLFYAGAIASKGWHRVAGEGRRR